MRNLRRTALSLVLAVALLAMMAVPAFAGNPSVSITVRAGVVAIENTQTEWLVGIVAASAEVKWGASDTYSTITNTGTVNVDVKLVGGDLVAGNVSLNWELSDDGSRGDQTYGLKATNTTSYDIVVNKAGDGQVAVNLPHSTNNTVTWSMTFYVPTAFDAGDDGAEKSGSVTIVATKA